MNTEQETLVNVMRQILASQCDCDFYTYDTEHLMRISIDSVVVTAEQKQILLNVIEQEQAR